jgi:deazaflavin-dependent oxidoreductase (nitroreductase family)
MVMSTMTSVQPPGGRPNTIRLGPRARRAIRLVAGLVNPVVRLIAGRRWMPVVGILRHRGRRSGRVYPTPLGMRPMGDGFVMPLTFSEGAAWYQNVVAAGGAQITYGGRTYEVTAPEVLDYQAVHAAFPRYERLQFRALGINQYLRLRRAADGQLEAA